MSRRGTQILSGTSGHFRSPLKHSATAPASRTGALLSTPKKPHQQDIRRLALTCRLNEIFCFSYLYASGTGSQENRRDQQDNEQENEYQRRDLYNAVRTAAVDLAGAAIDDNLVCFSAESVSAGIDGQQYVFE